MVFAFARERKPQPCSYHTGNISSHSQVELCSWSAAGSKSRNSCSTGCRVRCEWTCKGRTDCLPSSRLHCRFAWVLSARVRNWTWHARSCGSARCRLILGSPAQVCSRQRSLVFAMVDIQNRGSVGYTRGRYPSIVSPGVRHLPGVRVLILWTQRAAHREQPVKRSTLSQRTTARKL